MDNLIFYIPQNNIYCYNAHISVKLLKMYILYVIISCIVVFCGEVCHMKFGVRKPSVKRSISARTTGRIKRTVNKTVNPLYGKSGMGYINNPQKAVYNKIYNKTTIGVTDIIKSGKENDTIQSTVYSSTIEEYKEKASYYKILAVVWAIVFAAMSAFLGAISIFVCIIGTILFWNIGKSKSKKVKEMEVTLQNRDYSLNSSSNYNSYNSKNTYKSTENADCSIHKETDKSKTAGRVEMERNPISKEQSVSFDAVLVYNGSEKMQWEIQQVHKGDKIEIEIDDNDRYLVSTKDSYDIGYLHKKISDKIDNLLNDDYEIVDGRITDITENEGKWGVKVHIVLENRKELI